MLSVLSNVSAVHVCWMCFSWEMTAIEFDDENVELGVENVYYIHYISEQTVEIEMELPKSALLKTNNPWIPRN